MTYEIKIPNVPIKIRRNNDWEKTLAFKQPNGSLVDLDGAPLLINVPQRGFNLVPFIIPLVLLIANFKCLPLVPNTGPLEPLQYPSVAQH